MNSSADQIQLHPNDQGDIPTIRICQVFEQEHSIIRFAKIATHDYQANSSQNISTRYLMMVSDLAGSRISPAATLIKRSRQVPAQVFGILQAN
jgi:hypothetical protein